MSRTNAHTPACVLQLRPEHQIHINHYCGRNGRACDAGETVTATTLTPWCSWDIPWQEERRHWGGYRNAKKDRHDAWWGPDRAHTRDTLHDLVKAHRGGDLLDDTDQPDTGHRHTPWRGGYWD
ncbi:hypothetical protein [Agromyces humi]|uniref:hypothetical protein n=1 Tax=Agromyces humi TaxID=1766800 RepID=UPI00135CEFE4|nr:hypothetical protein [Agromyces humi]